MFLILMKSFNTYWILTKLDRCVPGRPSNSKSTALASEREMFKNSGESLLEYAVM